MATAINQNDPRLVAIKAELLHGIPELTGNQINRAAFLAVAAINRLNETSKPDHFPWQSIMDYE
jgi:hypothetical protein